MRKISLIFGFLLLSLLAALPASGQDTPDELIVFSGEGADIYIMHVATGQLTQLTSGQPIDIHPMLSPDGQTIVFERSWGDTSTLMLVDIDGDNLRPLVEDGKSPAWSPDGKQIIYSAEENGKDTIFVVDSDGRNRARLLAEGETGMNPVWSPDGTRIAFIRQWNVYVMDADGRNVRPVFVDNQTAASCPAWSPDGQRLVFHNLTSSRQIFVIDADGRNAHAITEGPEDNCPTWSPDGQQIAFAAVKKSSTIQLYRVDVDGSNLVKLTEIYGHYPSWWTPEPMPVAAQVEQADAPPAADAVTLEGDDVVMYDTPVSGEITDENGEAWRFFGTAGDFVTITATTEANTLRYLWFEVAGPTSAQTWQTNSSRRTSEPTLPLYLPETGVYTVTVNDAREGTGTYALTVASHTPAGELAYGDRVEAELTNKLGHVWTFEAQAGDRVSIAVTSDDFDTAVSLYDTDSDRVAYDYSGGTGTNSHISYQMIASSGIYVINVNPRDDATGAYTIWIDNARPPVGELSYGTPASGEIQTLPGERWTFTGKAGDIIYIEAESDDFQPYVELYYEPYGQLYASSFGRMTYYLPETSEYTLVTRAYDLLFGEYDVTVELLASDGEVTPGVWVPGDFVGRKNHVFRFTANEGDYAWIRGRFWYESTLDLTGPDGSVVTGQTGFFGSTTIPCTRLPATGEYRVDMQSDDMLGSYTFGVILTDEAPHPINYGQRVSGEIVDMAGDCWQFEGRAEHILQINLESDDFDTVLELYDPAGNPLEQDDDGGEGRNSRLEDFSLPVDGTYTIVARSFSSNDTGTYSLLVENLAPEMGDTEVDLRASHVVITPANAADLVQQGILYGHQDEVAVVTFTPEGALASGGGGPGRNRDSTIRLWDVETGENTRVIESHEEGVTSVAFSPDGEWMVSTGWDEAFKVYGRDDYEGFPMMYDPGPTPDEGFFGAAISANSVVAIYSSGGDKLNWRRLDDFDNGSHEGHTARIYSIAISPDSTLIASGSADTSIKLWDWPTFSLLGVLRGHSDAVVQVDINMDGTLVASASSDGTVRVWDAASAQQRHVFDAHDGAVKDVAFSSRSNVLASSGVDGMVYLWDAESGELLAELRGHTGTVNGVEFSPDGTLLASAGADASIRLWALPAGAAGDAPRVDCQVSANGTINVRSGPGTNNSVQRTLSAGESSDVIGQTTGNDGFTWWRLADGGWVREDVVQEAGDCPSVPVTN